MMRLPIGMPVWLASLRFDGKREVARMAHGTAVTIEWLEGRRLLSATIAPFASLISGSPADSETVLGVFGSGHGKAARLKVNIDSTHTATFSVSGGSGTVLQSSGGLDLQVTSGASLTIAVTHGGNVIFSKIDIAGKLVKFSAPSAELRGTLTAGGNVGSMTVGAISGSANFAGGISHFTGSDLSGSLAIAGNIAAIKVGNVDGKINVAGGIASLAAGAVSGTIYCSGELRAAKVGTVTGQIVSATSIASLSAISMLGATILAGDNLGSDGLIGGSGGAGDTFAAGAIDKVTVSGAVALTFIGGGVNPVDGIFGDGDDTSAGDSIIKSITARSADSVTRFEASAFGVANLPKKLVNVTADPRFIVL